jgi:hypothetical protein
VAFHGDAQPVELIKEYLFDCSSLSVTLASCECWPSICECAPRAKERLPVLHSFSEAVTMKHRLSDTRRAGRRAADSIELVISEALF